MGCRIAKSSWTCRSVGRWISEGGLVTHNISYLQLKQYISDFNEERAAREKMSEVVRLLESREKDSNIQIAQLRKQVTDLSTEKNDLSSQNDHLRLQVQQVRGPLTTILCMDLQVT